MTQRNLKSSEQRNFAFCYRPLYYFSRVFGHIPFTITHCANDSKVKAKLFIRDFIWFAISLFIHICLFAMIVHKFRLDNAISNIGGKLNFLICLLLGISAMVLNACNRTKIIRILNEITTFDENVRAPGEKSN